MNPLISQTISVAEGEVEDSGGGVLLEDGIWGGEEVRAVLRTGRANLVAVVRVVLDEKARLWAFRSEARLWALRSGEAKLEIREARRRGSMVAKRMSSRAAATRDEDWLIEGGRGRRGLEKEADKGVKERAMGCRGGGVSSGEGRSGGEGWKRVDEGKGLEAGAEVEKAGRGKGVESMAEKEAVEKVVERLREGRRWRGVGNGRWLEEGTVERAGEGRG